MKIEVTPQECELNNREELRSKEHRAIQIDSMSIHGDYLRFYINDTGQMYISMVEENRDTGAFFSRDAQLKLRDWLNEVLG